MTPNTLTHDEQELDGAMTDEQLAQRLAALERANAIRTSRAKLKRDLKASRAQIATVLHSPPECVRTAKVLELLLVLPRFGRVRVDKVLASCRISPTARIGALTDEQRAALVHGVGRYAPLGPATSPISSR